MSRRSHAGQTRAPRCETSDPPRAGFRFRAARGRGERAVRENIRWWSGGATIDAPRHDGVSVRRVQRRQRARPGEDARQAARRVFGKMHGDEYRRRERSPERAQRTHVSASTPPAEAPMTMMSRTVRVGAVRERVRSVTRRRRAAINPGAAVRQGACAGLLNASIPPPRPAIRQHTRARMCRRNGANVAITAYAASWLPAAIGCDGH